MIKITANQDYVLIVYNDKIELYIGNTLYKTVAIAGVTDAIFYSGKIAIATNSGLILYDLKTEALATHSTVIEALLSLAHMPPYLFALSTTALYKIRHYAAVITWPLVGYSKVSTTDLGLVVSSATKFGFINLIKPLRTYTASILPFDKFYTLAEKKQLSLDPVRAEHAWAGVNSPAVDADLTVTAISNFLFNPSKKLAVASRIYLSTGYDTEFYLFSVLVDGVNIIEVINNDSSVTNIYHETPIGWLDDNTILSFSYRQFNLITIKDNRVRSSKPIYDTGSTYTPLVVSFKTDYTDTLDWSCLFYNMAYQSSASWRFWELYVVAKSRSVDPATGEPIYYQQRITINTPTSSNAAADFGFGAAAYILKYYTTATPPVITSQYLSYTPSFLLANPVTTATIASTGIEGEIVSLQIVYNNSIPYMLMITTVRIYFYVQTMNQLSIELVATLDAPVETMIAPTCQILSCQVLGEGPKIIIPRVDASSYLRYDLFTVAFSPASIVFEKTLYTSPAPVSGYYGYKKIVYENGYFYKGGLESGDTALYVPPSTSIDIPSDYLQTLPNGVITVVDDSVQFNDVNFDTTAVTIDNDLVNKTAHAFLPQGDKNGIAAISTATESRVTKYVISTS